VYGVGECSRRWVLLDANTHCLCFGLWQHNRCKAHGLISKLLLGFESLHWPA